MIIVRNTFASNCARPAMSEETIRGRISIFSIRIKISPGKDISIIVSSVHSPSRAINPNTRPNMTPAIVRTSRAFSLSQMQTAEHPDTDDSVGDNRTVDGLVILMMRMLMVVDYDRDMMLMMIKMKMMGVMKMFWGKVRDKYDDFKHFE